MPSRLVAIPNHQHPRRPLMESTAMMRHDQVTGCAIYYLVPF